MSRRADRGARLEGGRCDARVGFQFTGFDPDTAPMTGDDIVRRPRDHLERTVDRVLDEERQPPEATRVTVADFDGGGDINHDHVEIDCDICEDNLAIALGLDGWKTPERIPGQSEQPHREHIGHYVLCTPCKESWERADYNDLYQPEQLQ